MNGLARTCRDGGITAGTVAAEPEPQSPPDRWVPFPNTADRSFERQPSVSRFASQTRSGTSKEKEGHFVNGIQSKWWIFYSKKGNTYQKCQIKNNKKNGYCLLYKKHKLTKAVKFKEGVKLKEWNNLSSFAEENNLNDLK